MNKSLTFESLFLIFGPSHVSKSVFGCQTLHVFHLQQANLVYFVFIFQEVACAAVTNLKLMCK